MAKSPKKPQSGNPACSPDCECPCCSCPCPYCTLAVLIDQLMAKGVCADQAATVAAEFVAARCR